MRAGLTTERFWSLDEDEVLLEIEAHQRRTEDLDAHLAHYASILLSPHGKRGRAPKPEKLRMFRSMETESTEESNVVDLDERRRFIAEHLAAVGSPR